MKMKLMNIFYVDIFPTITKIKLVAVDKVFVPRRTYYPLKPCGDGSKAAKETQLEP